MKNLFALVLLATVAVAHASEPLEFSTTGVRGETIDLAGLRGQWVVVNYWATWCKPCRKEIPDLSELHQGREDTSVIGLAFEEAEVPAILAFLEQHPAAYPVAVVDVYEPPVAFGAPRVLPTTIVLDPQGRVAKTFLGPVTRAMLEQYIDGSEEGP